MMRAAIVGCGVIADVHARCLTQNENCSIVAFADIKKERAEGFAERFGGNVYTDYQEMLVQEKPDVLHICTPHYLHVPMTIAALKAGVNVFMEKPPVISREQLEELKAAVAEADGKLGICFQNRYNPCVRMAKQLIDSGEAGKVLGARGLVTWHRDETYYTGSDWRGRLETEGGGALINQTIHTLDLLHYMLGRPLMAEASMSNHHLKGVIEVEDTVEAYIRFEKSTASFYATTAYCTDVPPLIEIACENMRIRMEDPGLTIYHKDGRIECPDLCTAPALGKSYYGSGHKACIGDYYDCLTSGCHFPQEFSDMEDSIRLMLAVYESARTGKVVEL